MRIIHFCCLLLTVYVNLTHSTRNWYENHVQESSTNQQQNRLLNGNNQQQNNVTQTEDQSNIHNFNDYLPKKASLNVQQISLSHHHLKLSTVSGYAGGGELWQIWKVEGTKNQIRLQALGGEFFQFLAHDNEGNVKLKCFELSTQDQSKPKLEGQWNDENCSIPESRSNSGVKFSDKEEKAIKSDQDLVWELSQVNDTSHKILISFTKGPQSERVYLRVSDQVGYNVLKKISNAISKTTFLTSDKDNQNAHWTLEVGAFIRLI